MAVKSMRAGKLGAAGSRPEGLGWECVISATNRFSSSK